MKKALCLMLAFTLVCFAGCKKNDKIEPELTDATEAAVSAIPERVDGYLGEVNEEKKTVMIYPVSMITYDDYAKALESDSVCVIGEEKFTITINEEELYATGYITLTDEDGNDYKAYLPKKGEATLINGYKGNEAIELKFDEKTVVRYGVLGYDTEGNAIGYESCGYDKEYPFEEYYTSIEEMEFVWGRYVAQIKDGVIVLLDALYHQ